MYFVTAGIGPMSDEELSVVMDNSRYLTGVAVSGYNGADVDLDGTTQNMNLAKSNTLPFINIDNQAGNMRGEMYCSFLRYFVLCCIWEAAKLLLIVFSCLCSYHVCDNDKRKKDYIRVMLIISYDSKHIRINLKGTVF